MEKMLHTADGLDLWSEAFGRPGDRPVLLVMGAMNQGIFWPDAFCEQLAGHGCYVVRYDHRDTGRSSVVDYPARPYRLAEMAQDARAVLAAHGLARANVVGLSMGGYIAQLLAIDSPQLVERLVLISSSADQRPYMAATLGQPLAGAQLPGPGAELLAYIRATQSHPPRSADEVEQSLLSGWALTYGGSRPFPATEVRAALRRAAGRTQQPMAAFNHALAVAASSDRLEGIKTITVPTLVIHGRHDSCLPLAHGDYLAGHIPGARLKVLDMGHSFMWSWDAEVLASLLEFFDA